MRLSVTRLKIPLFGLLILTSLVLTYWTGHRHGYHAGLTEMGPDHRALMVVRRTKGNPNSVGTSATWFNARNPGDVAKLKLAEERLKAAGAEFYVAKGRLETTLSPEPDRSRVNSHQ